MRELTSLSLIRRIQSLDDERSWNEFTKLYDQIIRHWLVAQGVREHDADDITQEVMAYVANQIGQFEHTGRPGAFRNWLRRITSFRIQQFWRKKKRSDRGGVNLGDLAEELADQQSGVSRVFSARTRSIRSKVFVR